MNKTPIRIACFGDSLTEGYGLEADEALPVVLEELLYDQGIRATCLNFGVSGDTASDGLARINAVLETQPDAAIVEFGANDCFVSESIPTIKRTFTAIIETLNAQAIPVLLVGITALPDLDAEYKAEFDPIFNELAARYDLPLFPDILSCYFGDSSLTLMDGLHPNAQGVRAIARGLLPQTIELVQKTKI